LGGISLISKAYEGGKRPADKWTRAIMAH